MSDLAQLGTALIRVVPTLKRLTQLSGFSIALVLFLIGYISKPPNLAVLIAAGLIGVSVLLFTLSLNVLESLPKEQRVNFILFSFFGFLLTITIFFVVAVYFLLKSPDLTDKAEAGVLISALQQKYTALDKRSERLTAEKKELQRNIDAESGGFADLVALEAKLKLSDTSLAETTRQLNLVVELLTDLASPTSRLAAVIGRAKANLGLLPEKSLGLITEAQGANRPEVLTEDLGTKILQETKVEDSNFVVKCLDAAWVFQVREQLDDAQAVFAKLSVIDDAKRNPRVIEGRAELAAARGNFSESIELTDSLISVLESASTPDLMALALALKDRASRSWANGDLGAAEKFYRRADDAYRRSRAPRLVVKANIQNELGYYYYLKGEFKKSLEAFASALSYFEKPDSSNYGKPHTFNNAALLYIKLGRYNEAHRYLRQSIDVQEKVIGRRTRLHATVLVNSAYLLLDLGKYEESKESFIQAGTILERWNGGISSKRLVDVGMAEVSTATNDRERALSQLLQAIISLEAASEKGSASSTFRVQLSRLFRMNGDPVAAVSALSGVSLNASERAPNAWREYLIERGTLEWWTSGLKLSVGSSESDFISFESGEISLESPLDHVRFLLWSAVRGVGSLNVEKAVRDFCRASVLLRGEVGKNVQLVKEASLVHAKFASIPQCM